MKPIKIKANIDNNEEKAHLLEIIQKLKGDLVLEFTQQDQNFLFQNQFRIVDDNAIFELSRKLNKNLLQQEINVPINEIIGINQSLQFIAIHNIMNNHFKQLAKLNHILLVPDWINGVYAAKSGQNLNENQNKILLQMNEQIKNTNVFSIFCHNRAEQHCKIDFFWQHLTDISKLLESSQHALAIGIINEPQEYVKCLNPFIFVLQTVNPNENIKQEDILKKQLLLNKYYIQNFQIKSFIINVQKTRYSRIMLKEIAQDIMCEFKNTNVKVGYNQYDITNFQRNNYIQIQIYGRSDHLIGRVIQQMFEERAEDIIQLSNQEMVIFDQYLKLSPNFKGLNMEYKQTIKGMKVKSSINQVKQFRQMLKDSFNQLQTQSVIVKLETKIQQYFQLMNFSQLKVVLTSNFMVVLKHQYILSVEGIAKNQIEIRVYLNNEINNDIVELKTKIEEYLSDLQILPLSEDQLALLELSIEQVQEKYQAIIIFNDYKYACIIPFQQLELVQYKLESYKTMVQLQYKPYSKIIARRMRIDFFQNVLQLPPECLGVKLSSDESILYIQCQAKDQGILDYLSKYEKNLSRELFEVPIEISQIEAKQLQKRCKKELEHLQQTYHCEISFPIPQIQPISQKEGNRGQIKSNQVFMKFHQKTVIFTSNYHTDVYIRSSFKHPLDQKITFKQDEKMQANALTIKEFLIYQQKRPTPFKQFGIIYDEVRETFSKLLKQYMMQDQTKFTELLLFINDPSLKEKCEEEALLNLQQSLGQTYQDFQWQWSNSKEYFDYDDVLINAQIEKGYQEFLNGQGKNEIPLRFPYSYQPGTHTINIKKNSVLDHANGNTKQLHNKNGIYYIGNEAGDDIFNQFIQEMVKNNQSQFTVFLKKYKIWFKSRDEVYQINLDSNFKRRLRRCVKQDPYYKYIADFVSKQYSQQTITMTPESLKEVNCSVKLFPQVVQQNKQLNDEMQEMKRNYIEIQGKDSVQKIQSQLLDSLEKLQVTFSIFLPDVNDQIFFSFMDFLSRNSVEIVGEGMPKSEMRIKTFPKQREIIIGAIEFFQNIPSNWGPQSLKNLYSIDQVEVEKQQILQIFPFLEIKKLQSVCNFNLWNKYQQIKQKLSNQLEQLVLYGNEDDDPLEEVQRVGLNLSYDYEVGPLIKCGTNPQYLKDKNYFNSGKGERQILICQVLLGQPKEIEQYYIIGDYSIENYMDGDYFYIKRNRMYPKYIVTLMDQN